MKLKSIVVSGLAVYGGYILLKKAAAKYAEKNKEKVKEKVLDDVLPRVRESIMNAVGTMLYSKPTEWKYARKNTDYSEKKDECVRNRYKIIDGVVYKIAEEYV